MKTLRALGAVTLLWMVGCAESHATAHAADVQAESKTIHLSVGNLPYKDGAADLEGYLALPKLEGGQKLPAVIVVHDWMGISDDTKMRVDQIAQMGYVALAADVYGKGNKPATQADAGKLAGSFKNDRALMRSRMNAALTALLANPNVDPSKVVVIGYCFGGTAALELGRSGAAVAGIVTFHGGLSTPTPADGKNIKGRVLVLHGADDPHVKPDEVQAFEQEMRDGKIDWELVSYGNAVHAFTIKGAGSDNSQGAAYNAKADARSWAEFHRFLDELWAK